MTCRQVVERTGKLASHSKMNVTVQSSGYPPSMDHFKLTYGRVIEVVRTDQLTNIIRITIERVPDSLVEK
jgi:hypothetical protein